VHQTDSRRQRTRQRRALALLALAAGAAGIPSNLLAATSTYTQAATPGTWSNPSAWVDHKIPNGIDEIANFTAVDLPLSPVQTVTLDTSKTIGGLIFADVNPSSSGQWKIVPIDLASLTLANTSQQPLLSVDSTTAEIAASVISSNGFQKSSSGTLVLSAANTMGGSILLSDGTLHLRNNTAAGNAAISMSGGRIGIQGDLTIGNQISIGSSAGTIGLINSGSSGTLSGGVSVGNSGALNVVFGGTGQTLNLPSLGSPNFAGTLAFHNFASNFGTFRISTSLTSGSNFDLGAATVDFGNASVNFGFNQGSVTAIMPYITGGTNAVIGVGASNRTNHYILGTQAGNQTFYGALRDGGSPGEFIKAGNGTFTLTSGTVKTHDFTGDLLIQGGTFVLGNNANISASPNIRIQNGTLAIAGNGTLSGNSTIIVSKTGALNLRQTSGTFATPPGVTIGGTGNVFGGLAHSAGTLAPGGISKVGTLTIDALADHSGVSFGAGVVELDFNAPGIANIGGGTNDLIVVHGDLNFSPDTIFRFNYIGDSLVSPGQDFPFLYYSGNRSGWGSGTLSTTSGTVSSPFRAMFELHDLGGGVIAARTGPFSGGPQSMTWTGSNSSVWDLNITQNFRIGANSTTFFQNDSVTFDDGGIQRPNVSLANAIILPGAVIFNNSTAVNYLLTGPGTIAGLTGVFKNGAGTVTINTANTYTGNTTINSGVLSSGNISGVKFGQTIVSSPLGLSTVYVGNATGDATLSFGSASFVNDVVVSSGTTANLNFNNGSASIFGSWRGGGTINLNGGGGNLNLYADNSTPAGTVNVTSSTVALRLANPNAMAGHVWNMLAPRAITNIVPDASVTEIPIGGLSGSGTLSGIPLVAGGYVTLDRAYAIGGMNTDGSWNGEIANGAGSGSSSPPLPTTTSLIKQGTASLILTGVNVSYTGETVVRGGVLQISNSGTPVVGAGQLTGTRVVRVGNGGTLRLGTPGGTLSTAGSITTASTGLLLTTDAGGIIDVSNAYDGDPIYNPNPPHEVVGYQSFVSAPGVTWAGNGTIIGSVRHQAGTLSPGANSGFGSIGALHFNDALRLYGGAISLDVGSISASHDTLIADTIDIASGTVVVNVIGNSIATNGVYNLMSATNVIGNVTSFQGLVVNGRGASGVLQQIGNQINLKILTPAVSARSTWAGGPGATWDVKGGMNWSSTGGAPDFFYQGDTVTFTDDNAGTVQLATPLRPAGQVTVHNSTTTYWFTGPGKISGNASLLKTGAGTLVITTDNDFTGGVTINDGTLAVGRDNRFDPNGSYSTSSIQNVSLALGNKTGLLGTGPIVNNGNLVFRKNSPTFVNQNISGSGALYNADFGVLILNGTNTYTGGTTVSLGTLRLGHDNALPGVGSLTLLGTTNFTGGGFASAGRGGKLDLAGFSQTIDELNAIGDSGTPGQPMDAYILNSATLINNISTLTINRTGTLGFNSGIRDGTEGNNLPVGQIALVKNSDGVATMNYTTSGTIATNYSGRTTINGGTIIVRGTHSPAGGNSYGSYVINSGAALAGDGNINALINVSSGAILAPGIAGQTGALSVDKLSLNTASLQFDLINGAADRVNVSIGDAFTLSGVSNIDIANPGGTFSTGTFTLIDYSGESIGNLLSKVSLGSTPGGEFNYFLSNNLANTSLDLVITRPIVSATWQTDSAGTWSDASKWSTNPVVPEVLGSVVTLDHIAAEHIVTLDAPYGIGTMNFNSAAGFTIAGTSFTTLSLGNLSAGGDVGINVAVGAHNISVPLQLLSNSIINIAAGSTLSLSGSLNASGNTLGYTITKTGAGTLVVQQIRNTFANDGTSSLNVLEGTVRVAHKSASSSPDGTSRIHSLSISSDAKLDLTNNSVVIDYSQYNGAGAILSQLRGWLADGRLYSSDADANHALGYRDNLDVSGSGNAAVLDFAGVSTDSTSVLIRYTYAGDSNLDGAVDIQDLYNLAVHYGDADQVWQHGDFNYDGKVSVADLTCIAINWQAGASVPASQDLGAMLSSLGLPNVSVPEPSMTLLLGAGLTGLLSVRRRRGC
jgi:autotransporter-associated beta strand protein